MSCGHTEKKTHIGNNIRENCFVFMRVLSMDDVIKFLSLMDR